jgi:glucokinase
MASVPHAIGIDIGATQIKAVLVTTIGEILHSQHVATEDASEKWKTAVPDVLASIEMKFGKAAFIGISSPGLAARDHSSITWMQGRLAGTQGYVWRKELSRNNSVPVINDAHAALLGEAWIGAARGASDVVMITLGTGVGGAILSGGQLLEGRLGRAGHIGHLSLDPAGAPDIVNTPGSLEDAIGENTLSARSGGRFLTTRELIDATLSGDADAAGIWRKSIRALAAGLVSVINLVDPELIVIGGGISKAGDVLFAPLREEMERMEWRPTAERVSIVPARLGDLAGAFGAARFAIELEKGSGL